MSEKYFPTTKPLAFAYVEQHHKIKVSNFKVTRLRVHYAGSRLS